MKAHRVLVVLFVAALATVTTAVPAQAAPTIRFVKVYFDSPGDDTGANSSLNAEWARIKNFGARARTLTGWTIRDPQGHVYRFPTFTLKAGATVTLHTGRGTNTAAHVYWRQDGYVWNNTGDKAILKNRAGTRIDVCTWTGTGSYVVC